MEWIKIKASHVLLSGLTDEEIGRLVKIQALIATKEKLPNDAEISRIIRPKSLLNLEKKLESFGENLQLIAEKVLEDVVKSSKEKEKTAKRVQKYRVFSRLSKEECNALRNDTQDEDVTLLDKIREEEIREEKSIKKENILTDISKKKPFESSVSDTVSLWNIFAFENGLAQVRDLTQKRITGVKARLSEKNFKLEAVFREISCSEFLLGGNKDGWKVTFDFVFLSANNWLKIVEGNYRNNGKKIMTEEDLFNALK